MDYMGKFAVKFIFLTGVAIAIIIAFVVVLLIVIKVKRADYYRVIRIRQKFIAFITSVYFFGLGGIAIGMVLWMISFILFRKYIFAIDARRLEELNMHYEKKGRAYPMVENFDQIKKVFFKPSVKEITHSEWNYSFVGHLDALAVLLVLCILNIATISSTPIVIYAIEFLIVATAGYILISKLVYYLALTTPSSIFFLCPKLSYIPVVFLGALYYFVAIIMLLTTSGVI